MSIKEKLKRINLTFKPSEYWIFEEISKHSGKGNFIKDVLIEHFKKVKNTDK